MIYYVYYIVVINLFAIFIYGMDKLLAVLKKNRVSERFLLIVGFFGGSLGSLVGMILFRHKIRKIKFYIYNLFFLIIWFYISYRFYILEVL